MRWGEMGETSSPGVDLGGLVFLLVGQVYEYKFVTSLYYRLFSPEKDFPGNLFWFWFAG